jgi:hypothetical protein
MLEEDIKVLAYTLWEDLGRPEGQDKEIWLNAESFLKSQVKALPPGVKTIPFDVERLMGNMDEQDKEIFDNMVLQADKHFTDNNNELKNKWWKKIFGKNE